MGRCWGMERAGGRGEMGGGKGVDSRMWLARGRAGGPPRCLSTAPSCPLVLPAGVAAAALVPSLGCAALGCAALGDAAAVISALQMRRILSAGASTFTTRSSTPRRTSLRRACTCAATHWGCSPSRWLSTSTKSSGAGREVGCAAILKALAGAGTCTAADEAC